jgi:hypothetical protein
MSPLDGTKWGQEEEKYIAGYARKQFFINT